MLVYPSVDQASTWGHFRPAEMMQVALTAMSGRNSSLGLIVRPPSAAKVDEVLDRVLEGGVVIDPAEKVPGGIEMQDKHVRWLGGNVSTQRRS